MFIGLLFSLLIKWEWNCFSQKSFVKNSRRYEPTWESLDTRTLPEWFDDAKIGIFMHYGLYSVPSFGSEWFWYNLNEGIPGYKEFMEKNYPPQFKYQDFTSLWKAELFDPEYFAEIVKNSGAKYYTLTSKHHEGFTLWKSNSSWNWNSVEVGPKKDFVGLLINAMRKRGIKVCLYFSLLEWYNPCYLMDKSTEFTTSLFVDNVIIPQLQDLVHTYHPDCLWGDGEIVAPSEYWKTKEFLAWLFNDSPVKDTVVVNDRWGNESTCKHGSFRNCVDRYLPDVQPDYKWENALTLDKYSWGYRRETKLSDVLGLRELLQTIFASVSLGGNVAINVGPTSEGTISLIYVNILHNLGKWLLSNGEAIYSTTPYKINKQEIGQTIWFTASKSNKETIYALFLDWPLDNKITLDIALSCTEELTIHLLGYASSLKFDVGDMLIVTLPNFSKDLVADAYALKIKLCN